MQGLHLQPVTIPMILQEDYLSQYNHQIRIFVHHLDQMNGYNLQFLYFPQTLFCLYLLQYQLVLDQEVNLLQDQQDLPVDYLEKVDYLETDYLEVQADLLDQFQEDQVFSSFQVYIQYDVRLNLHLQIIQSLFFSFY